MLPSEFLSSLKNMLIKKLNLLWYTFWKTRNATNPYRERIHFSVKWRTGEMRTWATCYPSFIEQWTSSISQEYQVGQRNTLKWTVTEMGELIRGTQMIFNCHTYGFFIGQIIILYIHLFFPFPLNFIFTIEISICLI
jgi:hypothetical protein